jgi:ArsR family transcriptional regulator
MSKYQPDEAERLADVFRALSNPHRLRIFKRLASCCGHIVGCCEKPGRLFVGEVSCNLGIAPSTVSHHIRELRQAGLIHMEKHGKCTACCVDPRVLTSLAMFFGEHVVDSTKKN